MRIKRTREERQLWVYYWIRGFSIGFVAGGIGGLAAQAALAFARMKAEPDE